MDAEEQRVQCHLCGGWYRSLGSSHLPRIPGLTADAGRLSYERSAYLFKQHSLKLSTTGWTLHQLRHSALTHLAEAGVNLPLLMAKSGHENLRYYRSTPGHAPKPSPP